MEFSITTGGLAPPLSEQLAAQGLEFCVSTTKEKLEKAAFSITYLKVHGLLSATEVRSAQRRLVKQVGKSIRHIAPGA